MEFADPGIVVSPMESGMKKKILVISWCMPPMVFPRSIQVARLLAALRQRGWESTVVCGDPTEETNTLLDDELERRYAQGYTLMKTRSSKPAYGIRRERILAPEELIHVNGACYQAIVQKGRQSIWGELSDSSRYPHASPTILYENDIPLGPGHSPHGQIEKRGYGCFSHWESVLFFSTSDNSDPRSNGRPYRISYRTVPHYFLDKIRSKLEDPYRELWLEAAVQSALQALSRDRYAALVSFAQPWVDHSVGRVLQKKTGLPWIAHFSDPWVDSIYMKDRMSDTLTVWGKKEKGILRHADSVLFTNSQARDLVMKKYPEEWRKKTKVIPHCFDAAFLPAVSESSKKRRMRLIYFGNVFSGRGPEAFLQALSILAQRVSLSELLQVDFIGSGMGYQKQADELGLKGVVTFHGPFPYSAGLKMAAEADVLLLMDAPSVAPSPFLPSKVVDYMMLKKMILSLTPEKGATADLMRRLHCPVVPPDDIPAIVEALAQLLTRWQTGGIDVSHVYEQTIQEYDVARVALQFEEVLSQAIAGNPRKYGRWW